MSITGNILIDKLRINIPIAVLNEIGINIEQKKQELRDILINYFYDKNAFSVTTAYNYLRMTLTPTRFKPKADGYFTDTNIEMPSEIWLFNLLKELGFNKNRRLDESANITWIHLTKNIITNYPPLSYIMLLADLPLRKRFISSLISSNGRNTTLRLSTPKRDISMKDILGDRIFLFYDKILELFNKAKQDNIILKQPLTKAEIEEIISHGGSYIKESQCLIFNQLSILRCELQYRYKDKIKLLQQFLDPNSNKNSLTIATILDLLSKNKLYSLLDAYYTNELRSVVFHSFPIDKAKKISSYQRALTGLLSNTDIVSLQLVYDFFDLGKLFQNNIKTLHNYDNDLYKELYNKFNIAESLDFISSKNNEPNSG